MLLMFTQQRADDIETVLIHALEYDNYQDFVPLDLSGLKKPGLISTSFQTSS
jgi:hypothetical protein